MTRPVADRRRRDMVVRAAVLVVPVLLTTSGFRDAGAEEVSREELEALARRAPDDPAALRRLRGVDRVDGRPLDLRRALDAPGPEAAERARALGQNPGPATAGTAGGAAGASAADDARAILRQRRFQPREAPRPLAGVLRRIGGWIRPVGQPVRRLVSRILENPVGLPVLAGMVVALATLVCVRVARRRMATNVVAGRSARRPTSVDPAELERRADAAEAGGDLELAFRLRFQAGLLRLHDAGRLHLRPSTTTGEVLRSVPSPVLEGLALTLEEIVYGERAAQAPDLVAARTGWASVLDEARP